MFRQYLYEHSEENENLKEKLFRTGVYLGSFKKAINYTIYVV